MATQKLVNRFNALVENYSEDDLDLSQLGDRIVKGISEAQSELVFGPRSYEIPKEDGALAFERACLDVLRAEPLNSAETQMMTLETQELVYQVGLHRFSKASLMKDMPLEVVEGIAEILHAEIPRDIERNREEIFKAIAEKAKVVGVYGKERQARMGIVNLYKNHKKFGVARLTERPNGDFELWVRSTHEHENVVADLVHAVDVEISRGSIYKGRAYDYSRKKFINDLEFDTHHMIVLASDLEEQIRSRSSNRIDTVMKARLVKEGEGKKKNLILANGKGGTGKTETARALGAHAIANGKAFLTYMPEKVDFDDFKRFMNFASKVGPAFILIEDIEKMVPSDPAQYSLILDILDGVWSKTKSMDIWVNSNNANEESNFFNDTFLRRFNVLFDFDQSSDATIQGLFAVYLSPRWELDGIVGYESGLLNNVKRVPDEDFTPHPKMVKLIDFVRQYDFKPWAIRQVAEASISYLVDRGEEQITEESLIAAAKSVVQLHNLVKKSAGTPIGVETIDSAIKGIVYAGLETHSVDTRSGDIVVK